jgi:hypothetical protein
MMVVMAQDKLRILQITKKNKTRNSEKEGKDRESDRDQRMRTNLWLTIIVSRPISEKYTMAIICYLK